ncbi:hypothetical protein DM02DRAFT_708716 [Periconia macrospinosa]|uniref:Zn(2)-C6 fungal-type domain-containing protein n=1 Tax=Periconia macrospinosa TaxID=97972 RepID=A0A2V1DQH8_9PLEO|nr:hypothetical protein DM02DRAFT_708716 [Periconia macrospinosa]
MAQNPTTLTLQWQDECLSSLSSNSAPALETPTGRPYRSRKERPCDACRKRKVHCQMPDAAPCQRCRRTGQACTFLQRPTRRQRIHRNSPASDLSSTITPKVLNHSFHIALAEGGLSEAIDGSSISPSGTSSGGQANTPPSNIVRGESGSGSLTFDKQNLSSDRPEYRQQSLEYIPGAFTFYIGPTGTSDAYLLQRQSFVEIGRSTGTAALPPTVFGITDYSIIDNAEPRMDPDQMEHLWAEMWKVIDRHTAWRLVRLYVRFVEPYFPLLDSGQMIKSPEELGSMTLALLSGICATAVPFSVYDEALYTLLPKPPSTQQLYRICWSALWQELHAPTLRTIQACLILQHRPPSNPVLSATAFQWSLMSTAVAAAQTIGLHREPASWHLVPVAERKLRRRLFWALYTMEKWFALARGMPSHMTEDEHDVDMLDTQDLEGSFCTSNVSQAHFENLVEMDPQGLDSNASLHLSYIAAHMTLLRGLLRPLDKWSDIVKHSRQEAESLYEMALAVVKGAIICVKELVEFVQGLRDAQWNAFWHSWSRPNFAIAGSFMIHLLHITTPPANSTNDNLNFKPQLEELHVLIKRWRWANRVSSNSAAGAKGLTNLGLFKVETLLASLGTDALPV